MAYGNCSWPVLYVGRSGVGPENTFSIFNHRNERYLWDGCMRTHCNLSLRLIYSPHSELHLLLLLIKGLFIYLRSELTSLSWIKTLQVFIYSYTAKGQGRNVFILIFFLNKKYVQYFSTSLHCKCKCCTL